ncbi:MAG: hypothetical protein QF464_19220 [Myxococcota bacterium]|nr:hypothetical protein [Myxococcota bacterium]
MRSILLTVLAASAALTITLTPPAEANSAPPTARGHKGLVTPAPDTPEGVLLAGLRLIADGQFDQWITRYCHMAKLCPTPQAQKSLKRYNLTAAQRVVGGCLKGDKKDQLRITRRVAEGAESKFFLHCSDKGMPRPFTLMKEGDAWKFRRI